MTKLFNSINHAKYLSDELKGKYIYFSKSYQDSQLYYIFRIESIDASNGISKIKYNCSKVYLLMVPNDKSRTVFLYDNYKEVIVNGLYDVLYEMTFSEYVNTFREFVKSDGKRGSELPNKIIQDE